MGNGGRCLLSTAGLLTLLQSWPGTGLTTQQSPWRYRPPQLHDQHRTTATLPTPAPPQSPDASPEGSRREMIKHSLASGATLVAALGVSGPPPAAAASPAVLVWREVSAAQRRGGGIPATLLYSEAFKTYLTRFLLHYDTAYNEWWRSLPPASRELSDSTWRRVRSSVDEGLAADWSDNAAVATATGTPRNLCEHLADRFGTDPRMPDSRNVLMQLAVLFELLDDPHRPCNLIGSLVAAANRVPTPVPPANGRTQEDGGDTVAAQAWWESPTGLFPVPAVGSLGLDVVSATAERIAADLQLAETRAQANLGELTPLTAVGAAPLSRERPLDAGVYALFALSGALGCTLTHSLLVPLDVVKTKKQVEPEAYMDLSLIDGAQAVVAAEGVQGLAQGLGPTIVGYTWYGLTVYPGYEFLKRLFFALCGPALATQLRVPLVLLAGAGATCIACLGVCPAETVRIRCVSEPTSGGSWALTRRMIADEGVGSLYSGLPPLLARQVSFGMSKFLVFDTFSELVYSLLPQIPTDGVPALVVSTAAGAVAGVVSTVVSQPGDAVLTKLSQTAGAGQQGFVGAAKELWALDGPGGFFYGLVPRAVWAGFIIAGQFFLYDVFKTAVHVTAADLSQTLDVFGSAGITASALS